MTTRQISISEFKAHCTEEIRQVEKGEVTLKLTRHGKTVAVVQPPQTLAPSASLKDWIGSGEGSVVFAPDYDPAGPAFAPEDWTF
jgi:prevent-host-death family protein